MASENIGANEDLRLKDEDADSVVGGKKKKKKTMAKKAPAKKAIQTTQAATTFTPRALTRDEMIAANEEAAAFSMEPQHVIPDLPTSTEE